MPSANFTANTVSGCSPLIVQFQDLSSGVPTAWAWDLGNGSVSSQQNPQATYFNPGTYTVRLTVTNATGSNTLTRTQYITVYAPPVVNFSVTQQSGCFPLRTQFTDMSAATAGSSIVSWLWDFGNGVTSTLQNPSAVYPIAGNFAVTLKVTDDKGCSRILGRSSYINVTPGVMGSFIPNPAIACNAPATIRFNNTSTGPGTLAYQWDFSDGGTSTAISPSHLFANTGTYPVTMVATSSAGCQDTVRINVPVGGFSSSFQSDAAVCPGTGVTFTNTSSPSPDSVRWSFGDGSFSSDNVPVHSYATAGTYTIWLYNYYGNCRDSVSRQITVVAPPVANFNASGTGTCQQSLTTTFQDLSTGAVSWLWNFGDNTTSTIQNPTHTYNGQGDYTVTLIVTNSSGCTDTLTRPAFVRLQRPQITLPALPARGCIPYTFSPVPVISAVDAIVSYNWDFGDGNTSTLQQPTNIYTSQGTYTVKLYFTTSTGCTDSAVFNQAVVVGSRPVADFIASPLEACAVERINFTNLSAPFTELLWSFGDGNSSTDPNPSFLYNQAGYFNVQLIATNSGCSDTMIKTNYIHILPPISRFSSTPDCSNRLSVSFTDESVMPQTWLWDFGDGATSNLQNPVHVFPAFGNYTVRLTVTNGTCSHSYERVVTLLRQMPDFTADVNTLCKGAPVTFTPVNLNSSLTLGLLWIFGDGTQLSGSGNGTVSHAYANAGLYNVTLIAIDANTCRDTLTKNAFIRVNGPTANFTALPPGGCTGSNITFTDQSLTDGTNPITGWTWDFGDGNIQTFTGAPFLHTYSLSDTFSVKLLVRDAAGCTDSLARPNYIITSKPTISFTNSFQTVCTGTLVSFVNTTTPAPVNSFWDFGDGNTSALHYPFHAYADTGLYTVKLVSTDSTGCVDSLIRQDLIRVIIPKASFLVSDSFSACVPLEVQFTNTSTGATESLWDFGPGEGSSGVQDPVHFFSNPGTYRVKLLIKSYGNCDDSAFVTITVLDTAGLRFNYTPLEGCNPLQINFSATGPVSTQSYFWDFGDGTGQSNTPNISHVYQSFGNYLPKVVLLDPPGCVIPVSGIDSIRIRGSRPLFGISDSVLCDAGLVNFTDSTTSSEPITSYSWNFGDGNTSTEQQPAHYYTAPGSYDITLTVSTQSGCVNTYTKTMGVRVIARPDIAISGDSTACIYDSLLHTGLFLQPDTSAVTWRWIFPNGNTSNLQNPPAQTYQPGSYTVFAYATNSDGCIDTAAKNITIYALPTVTMPGQMTIAVGFADTIPASYSNGVNQWTWTPPYALSCFNCPRPVASPRSTTTYQVAFSDINGCKNTGSIEVVVICKDANFYIPNTFSPNGDGNNDRFYPRGRGLYMIRSMRVFNRWGESVFENRSFSANDANAGWDGRYKGNRVQPDVYVYQIEIQCDNGETIKLSGNIALIL
ncbi:MAG: PKD domain-containing protein [Chitinophagaceae bacterium]